MDFIAMPTKSRTRCGKGAARTLRREARIPAVLYGPGTEPLMLSVNMDDLEKGLKKCTASLAVFNLMVDDPAQPERPAMLKELQDNPVNGRLLHADFYQIDASRKVRVRVPVTTIGKCKGVELGGMLQIIRRELEVACLPDRIPHKIEIDITDLGVGEAVHVEDLQLGEAIEIPHEVNFTVATVLGKRKSDSTETEETEEEIEGEAAV